jgi:predicted DNA-binding ribbon-helix-helix protein
MTAALPVLPSAKPRPRVKRRNVMIGNKRTTVIMEIPMWVALEEICQAEDKDLNAICLEIAATRDISTNFTSELRIFILEYFWKNRDQTCAGGRANCSEH